MTRLRDSDARLETIRSLLAKAEATTFPAEAEAFVKKATELMARYAIDEAMLWDADDSGREPPDQITLTLLRPFTGQKAILVGGVAQAFGCRAIRHGAPKGSTGEKISIVGFPSDLSLVETLVTSLFVQLTTALTASAPPNGTASQVAGWRRSFITAFAYTVVERIEESRAAAKRATATAAAAAAAQGSAAGSGSARPARSTDVVLAARNDEVNADFHRRYPNVRTTRVSAGTSNAGLRAGEAAGRRADIGSSRLRGRQALPKG
ncbi:MAG: DUF2786 domain-containing protein [Actinobacteria bacterium]|nr:DUF2786 domain-containing protein [Actinomycetota bacterium]